MPATIEKEEGGYTVRTPGGVKGRKMTLRNAKAQARLLNAIDHGWRPAKRDRRGVRDGKTDG
ncbi:MAG: hypothetical protein WHT06_15915 [Desulfobacterales bacterium]